MVQVLQITKWRKKLELKRRAEEAKAAAILKAQNLGLTAEDIAALKG